MDTPFTPKTHISKRIKIWAIVLLAAVLLASGLAILTGGKTKLFKGSVGSNINPINLTIVNTQLPPPTTDVNLGNTVDVMEIAIDGDMKSINETVEIIRIKLHLNGTATKNDIQNIKLKDSSIPVGIEHPSEKIFTLYFPQNLEINYNSTTTLTIQATVSDSATTGTTFQFTIDDTEQDIQTANNINIQTKSIKDTPQYTIVSSSVELQPILSGTNITVHQGDKNTEILKFKLLAKGSDTTIDTIKLKRDGIATNNDIKSIFIFEESNNAPISTANSVDNDNFYFLNPALTIQKNIPKTIIIKSEISDSATIGNHFTLAISDKNQIIASDNTKKPINNIEKPFIATGKITISQKADTGGDTFKNSCNKIGGTWDESAKTCKFGGTTFNSEQALQQFGQDQSQQGKTDVLGEGEVTEKINIKAICDQLNGANFNITLGQCEFNGKIYSSSNITELQATIDAQLETPTDTLESFKTLCLEQADKHPHSAYYTWKDYNKICVYDGKKYDSLEKLQEAMGDLNETVLGITCPNVGGILKPNGCEFNGKIYTNADDLNAAVEGKPAADSTPPAEPKLTLSIPTDAPKNGNVKQGETIETTAFELKAENNPIIITKLRITHLSPNDTSTTDDISSISIKSNSLLPITVYPDTKFPYDYIVIPDNLTIPSDTTIKFWIEAKVKETAPINNQFKLGFLEKENITAFAVDTPTPVEIVMPSLDQAFKTFGGTFTIATAESPGTPAASQLTVSKSAEIPAGSISAGASTDVLKLKFQAPADSDITVNSVKITTQGSATVTDLQTFKLIEGTNVVGSSTDIGITTLIATPSFTILKGASREITLNVTAKSTAVKDNLYLFRIQQAADISASTANVYLNPAPLSSQQFIIAAAAGGTPPPLTPTVSVTASPLNSQTSGQIVTFTITVNNGPGGLYNYSLDLGDGKTTKTLSSTTASATFDHSYSEAKTYTVKGSVTMVVNNAAATISAPDLSYTITTVAVAPPPPVSPEITNLQNQLALLQQQLANAQSSQSSQSTAQIQALTQQIAQLAALAAAKKDETQSKSTKDDKKKAKTPVETPEMWGAGPVAPVQPAQTYVPPAAIPPAAPAYLAAVPAAAPMYAAAPSLGYSQKLVKVPEKSNTGPEVLVYFIAVGAANAAWWVRKKIRK